MATSTNHCTVYRGAVKLFQDDRIPGICKINTKRRDGIEVLEMVVTDGDREFKRIYRTKICHGPFHGGLPCPGGHKPLEWYKWTIHSDKRTWWGSVVSYHFQILGNFTCTVYLKLAGNLP